MKFWNSPSARVALVSAGLALSGCAATPEQAKPLPPTEPAVTTAGPASTPAPDAAFDENGNPFAPGSQRLLERTFYFDYDTAVLQPQALAALELHAKALRTHPERTVVVEGHADERGSREYNLALGERRADAIQAFLLAAGVARRQIQTVSYGEERPEATGAGEAAWSRNRRALLDYSTRAAWTQVPQQDVVANR